MAKPTAIYDACVLYPAPLRDFLLHLALAGACRARWTDRIHQEWKNRLLERRPDLTREQLDRTQALMDAHTLGCKVTGYEDLIPSLELPDEGDRHVLAAAIRTKANVIVTFNLRDFPPDRLAPYGIQASHPDDFICQPLDLYPALVFRAARDHRLSLKNPPKDVDEFLDTLERVGLSRTAESLRSHRDRL